MEYVLTVQREVGRYIYVPIYIMYVQQRQSLQYLEYIPTTYLPTYETARQGL